MRKAIFAAAILAAAGMMAPTGASAQDALGGAIVGAGTGAIIGGAVGGGRGAAVGAVVGGTTGAAIGANAGPRERVRVCWHDDWGHRHCRWRYR
jgi:hypothetical protein